MKRVLTKAVVEAFAFLENCDDTILDSDAAVAQMESMAAILGELGRDEREEFVRYVEEMVAEAERTASSERVTFLRSLPQNIGLVD